jgi:hypothetical protein
MKESLSHFVTAPFHKGAKNSQRRRCEQFKAYSQQSKTQERQGARGFSQGHPLPLNGADASSSRRTRNKARHKKDKAREAFRREFTKRKRARKT